MEARRVLWKSTEDALNSLGNSAKQTLVWQLSTRGLMTPDNFDINRLAVALNDMLGEGSEPVLNLVYQNLCKHLKVKITSDPNLPALEKINKILEAKKMT